MVVLGPGCELHVSEDARGDALVEIEDGEVEVELASGRRQRFVVGDLIWLRDASLRALPSAPAVVVALWRTVRDEKSGGCRLNTHDDNHTEPDHRPRA